MSKKLEAKKSTAEYKKEYYLKHKADLTARHECEVCGGHYKKVNISIHIKSAKHMNAIKMQEMAEKLKLAELTIAELNK
jgi:hypothetical protein